MSWAWHTELVHRVSCQRWGLSLTAHARHHLNEALFSVGGRRTIEPHEVGHVGGLDRHAALKLLFALERSKVGRGWILVYHACNEEPVARVAHEDERPQLGWSCADCGEVTDEGSLELGYWLECHDAFELEP